MLDSSEFDLWADGYDESVGLSDEADTYPFAGYKRVLGRIYDDILSSSKRVVLDVGFGTGTLTTKLYEHGCEVFGQDFSERMIEIAQAKMPDATLCRGDLTKGLAEPLTGRTYDAIVATYAIHHLTDDQKVALIRSLLPLLSDGGRIYIGDVAFATRADLERCRKLAGDTWDSEELYPVYEELRETFPGMTFERMSHCAGVLTLGR